MTVSTNITCPKCGADFPLTDAVTHRIQEQLAAEFEQQRKTQNAALAQREANLDKLKQDLEKRAQSVDAAITAGLEAERPKLLAEASTRVRNEVAVELKDLQRQLQDNQSKLKDAQDAELELRRQKRELEEARENQKLDLARQLDVERSKIADAARQQATDAERLKLQDKEHIIKDLQDQITALKNRAEQGSMQIQGETLELSLQDQLGKHFLQDEIVEIKKGERGADILQRVRTNPAIDCGSILWEAKRAKNWAPAWIAKLKEDQREARAELAVLVTTTPPPGVRGIGQYEGIWVCEPLFACSLAVALRHGLVATAVQRTQESGRADKMSRLYEYLCSTEFRQHVEGVVEAFIGLQDQLRAEQRAFARQWDEREKQIASAIQHTAMLYGGIQGIAGRTAVPEIRSLSLPPSSASTLAAVELPAASKLTDLRPTLPSTN
jgi:hypothetical protein